MSLSMLGLNVMFMNRCLFGFCLFVINDANAVTAYRITGY